ncbi:MAG TPA: iron-sulfur cluster assembly scaffold protein [Parvularculaceae bacterium]|nr:iron-sulfur cluster assembly scaffold protein [Caulobacterales bacterium]HOP21129.1 iron-sulfur cluster assembly scaffold protein [Amphiplicatus sp.]HPE29788.1 iron-sulfur cluster assembly scaffold protein [Parvularculaceae bacterium]
MIGELYSDRILAAASSIPAARRLAGADASAKKVSRVCGSEVDVDLKMDGDTVSDFGMEARACALGQAAASIVARHVVGASAAELYRLRDEMKAMLKEGGPPPSGERWADLAVLEPIRDYPQRHASTMLVFEAIAACLDQLSAQHGEA